MQVLLWHALAIAQSQSTITAMSDQPQDLSFKGESARLSLAQIDAEMAELELIPSTQSPQ